MIKALFGFGQNKSNTFRVMLVDDSWASLNYIDKTLRRYFASIGFNDYEIVKCESYSEYLERGSGYFNLAFIDWNLSNNRQENGEIIALDLKKKGCPVISIFSGMEDDSALISNFTMTHLFFYVHKGEVEQVSKLHMIASKGIENWKCH